jgi:hypothetical protein
MISGSSSRGWISNGEQIWKALLASDAGAGVSWAEVGAACEVDVSGSGDAVATGDVATRVTVILAPGESFIPAG